MGIRDAILKAAAIPTEEGTLFGEKVLFRGLSVAEQTSIFDGRPNRELLIPVCAAGITDDKGKPVLSEEDFALIVLNEEIEAAFDKIITLTRPSPKEAEKNS